MARNHRPPVLDRRKQKRFTHYTKLWHTADDLAWFVTEAEARGWSVPDVIRACIALVRARRLLSAPAPLTTPPPPARG
jgi:hypothetical protein